MIDLQLIADKLEFDLEDVQMLLDMFLSDSLESFKLVQTSVETENFEQMKNIAHAIKGSAANLMLEEITATAYEIEQLAKKKDNADYNILFTLLEDKISSLQGIEV